MWWQAEAEQKRLHVEFAEVEAVFAALQAERDRLVRDVPPLGHSSLFS